MKTIRNPSVQINSKITSDKVVDQALVKLKNLFREKEIEQIAWETRFVKRSSARLWGFNFLKSILLLSCDKQGTLERMSEMVTRVDQRVKISAQALMKRINQETSVQFLQNLYSKILKEKIMSIQEPPAELLMYFSKILLQDSSTINLHEKLQEHFKGSGGRASKASAKFDVIYNWKSKDYEEITLTDRGEADQKLGLKISDFVTEKTLVIRDLGYLRVDSLVEIVSKKAFFLSRLRSSLQVYLNADDRHPTDIADYIAKYYKNTNQLDLTVYITPKKLPVRLVIYKAPERVATERRRKAKATAKKEGRNLRDKTLKFMDYSLFITNVPTEIWQPEVIGTVYRIRWQIELIFKCWKSKIGIHYLKGIDPRRIRCLIYAKLILILLMQQVYKLVDFIGSSFLNRIVSMYKVYAWLQNSERLLQLIKGKLELWERKWFVQTIFNSMCMQKRKRKTTLESISEGEFYCSNLS